MSGLIAPQHVYSKLFQPLKFQLLCHDPLFQCRFIFGFCLISQKAMMLIICSFFMFCSMVDKCLMTLEQQFSIFWQQTSHLEIYSYQHYQPGKTTFEDWISFSCYVIWVMDDVKCSIFVALIMAVAAEIVIEKSGICVC